MFAWREFETTFLSRIKSICGPLD